MADSDVIWQPSDRLRADATLTGYMAWLADVRGLEFSDYDALWRWSIQDLDAFWASVWDYFGVADRPAPARFIEEERMPGAVWCSDVTLNFAEELMRRGDDALGPALICVPEDGLAEPVSWAELRRAAGALAGRLREMGVERGDRVVGYLGNTREPVIALVACASIGAIWNVCSPDFGTGGVVSRFGQLAPKVLIATTGYRFGGKAYDRQEAVEEIAESLPTVEHVIWVDGVGEEIPPSVSQPAETWSQATDGASPLTFEPVPFEHPLWVLFSSGTTGNPKGITHGHGGIAIELLKVVGIQGDIRPGDRYLLLGSTSWMVWNVLASSLLVGATAVLVDGSPAYPDLGRVWRIADEVGAAVVGVGAGFLHACNKAALQPRSEVKLAELRCVLSTGSPLSPAGYRWVMDALGNHVWLSSQSGGTDVASAFVGGCSLLPVRMGRIQARFLGVAVAAWDDEGKEVVGERGELVVTRPMPSMPLYLWGDRDRARETQSYFSTYPGVWRHGDFIEFDTDGSSIIHGRSDSTLNRNGVRMGSADIYEIVEALPEVQEALVVGAELGDEDYYMPLFVDLADGADPNAVWHDIIAAIRRQLSPRHVPDDVIVVPGIPHTRTGKKLEVPIKRILQGVAVDDVADADAVDRPELLAQFARHAPARPSGA